MEKDSDTGLEYLQREKLRREIEAILINRRLEWLKVLITAIGTLVLVAGLLYQNNAWRRQREWDTAVAMRQARHTRMLQIADDFDELYLTTIEAIFKHKLRLQITANALWFAREQVINSSLKDIEKRMLVGQFETIEREMRVRPAAAASSDDQAAISLGTAWVVRQQALAPDWHLYYREDVTSRWPKVQALAMTAISTEFAQLQTPQAKATLEQFRKEGADLASALRTSIQNDAKKIPRF